jgi:hypothetical protein
MLQRARCPDLNFKCSKYSMRPYIDLDRKTSSMVRSLLQDQASQRKLTSFDQVHSSLRGYLRLTNFDLPHTSQHASRGSISVPQEQHLVRSQVNIGMMLRAILQVNHHPSETPFFVDDTHGAGSARAAPKRPGARGVSAWCLGSGLAL